MTFHQFLLIIRSRYKIVLSILLFTVITTLVISLLLPKQYTANTSVVVDVKSPDPIAGMVLPGLASPAYMATQIDIINSERVAERVVKMLRMDENAAIKEQWMDDGGKGSLTIWLLYPCLVFIIQGAAWGVAYALRRRAWLGLVALGWSAAAVVMAFFIGSPTYALIASLSMFVLMFAPGAAMLLLSRKGR